MGDLSEASVCMLRLIFIKECIFLFPVDPLYYWQQTDDDLTVTVRLPENCAKEDIRVQFLPESINVTLKDVQVLEGRLYSSVDHESSTWTMKENDGYACSFTFEFDSLWSDL